MSWFQAIKPPELIDKSTVGGRSGPQGGRPVGGQQPTLVPIGRRRCPEIEGHRQLPTSMNTLRADRWVAESIVVDWPPEPP